MTTPTEARVIAGALFDFLGYLTTRDKPTAFGACELATPAVDLLEAWAKTRALSLDEADVHGWSADLARQPTAPAGDIDEAHLALMTERGAVAWAGVDPQALREGGQPSTPSAEPADVHHLPGTSGDSLEDAMAWMAQQTAPQAGPVAEILPGNLRPGEDGKPHWCREVLLYSPNSPHDHHRDGNHRVKLYTAAPAPTAQPLTDASLLKMAAVIEVPAWEGWFRDEATVLRFARSALAAAGITATPAPTPEAP